jgi:hypothetical protein
MIEPTLFYVCIILNGYYIGQAGTLKQLKLLYKITSQIYQKLDLTDNLANIKSSFLPTTQDSWTKYQLT